MKLTSWSGPQPTPRTNQWLRIHDLVEDFEGDDNYGHFIERVNSVVAGRMTAENIYVLSELAFISGKRAEYANDRATAFDMYGIAVTNAYLYLVDKKFDLLRNPYDPRFRQACDLYNGALESAMRLTKLDGPLRPGTTRSIETQNQSIHLSIVSKGNWRPDQIERVEFASDYVPDGLTNHVRRFGLGVPLIAVHRSDPDRAEDQFYAPGMSIPATAFFRVVPKTHQAGERIQHTCVLELHDPLTTTDVTIDDGRMVPLEADFSTPLAYSLSDPMFQQTDIGTRGLINPGESQSVQGIYMLEPYDPDKVPVIMVHGLWSSLITWMEMFNDLRGDNQIRNRYQFWFYLYPTGQPFWMSAAQLREELAHLRNVMDPDRLAPTFDQTVLVGHSMGGLISKLQTLQSDSRFWDLISEEPIDELKISADLKEQLRNTWFFTPNPSISRVVTIATPHRGSEFSNGTTQWLARNLIRLPETFAENTQRLFSQNATLQRSRLLRINTSVESLAPDSPVFLAMLQASHATRVIYHNIVGVLPDDKLIGRVSARGDGVVKYESAHLEDVASEAIVTEDHVKIHQHPQAILEVQRVLLEHLSYIDRAPIANTERAVRR